MSAPATPFGREAIEAIIPHRDPFLLVDEIVELVPGERVHGRYTVRGRRGLPRRATSPAARSCPAS